MFPLCRIFRNACFGRTRDEHAHVHFIIFCQHTNNTLRGYSQRTTHADAFEYNWINGSDNYYYWVHGKRIADQRQPGHNDRAHTTRSQHFISNMFSYCIFFSVSTCLRPPHTRHNCSQFTDPIGLQHPPVVGVHYNAHVGRLVGSFQSTVIRSYRLMLVLVCVCVEHNLTVICRHINKWTTVKSRHNSFIRSNAEQTQLINFMNCCSSHALDSYTRMQRDRQRRHPTQCCSARFYVHSDTISLRTCVPDYANTRGRHDLTTTLSAKQPTISSLK